MPRADGVAYRTRPSSSTIRMTSEVSWTRVRKYASLSLADHLLAQRRPARPPAPTCRASTSRVAGQRGQSGRVPNTASTPISGSPEGRSCRASGQSRTLSTPASSGCSPVQRRMAAEQAGPEAGTAGSSPVTAGRQVSVRRARLARVVGRRHRSPAEAAFLPHGEHRGLRRARPGVRNPTPDRTAPAACSTVAAAASAAPACRRTCARARARRSAAATSARRDSTRRYSRAEQTAMTPASYHVPRTDSTNSTPGATSAASMIRASRKGELGGWGAGDRLGQRGHGRVQRGGPPRGVEHSQPRSVAVPGWNELYSWSSAESRRPTASRPRVPRVRSWTDLVRQAPGARSRASMARTSTSPIG